MSEQQSIPENDTSLRPLTASQRELIEGHVHLASWTAKKYCRRLHDRIPFDDLYSEALWGLVHGAATFDPAYGVPFEAYARITIRSRLQVFLRDHFRQRSRRSINLTGHVAIHVDRRCEVREERQQQINFVRRALPKRWFDVLYQHFVEGSQISRIARSMGITTQCAHQIVKRAIEVLHEAKSLRNKRLLRIQLMERKQIAKDLAAN